MNFTISDLFLHHEIVELKLASDLKDMFKPSCEAIKSDIVCPHFLESLDLGIVDSK